MWTKKEWDPGDFPVERMVLDEGLIDLLMADRALGVPIKCDVEAMELPIFSLSKRADKRVTELMHPDGKQGVRIYPGPLGRPTIFDKDVFHFCVSQVVRDRNRGNASSKRVRFPCKVLLDWVGRDRGGRSYKWIGDALRRLSTVKVERKRLAENGRWETNIIGLIDQTWWIDSGKGRIEEMQVDLSDRVWAAILAERVLTYPKEYYDLTSPIERRMYEIGRRYCGTRHRETKFNIDVLHFRFGSTAEIRKFREMIKSMVKHQNIPQYIIEYNDRVKGGQIRIVRREDVRTVEHPGAPPSLWTTSRA